MCTKRPTERLPQISWRVSQVLHCRQYPTNGGRLFGMVPQRADVSWRHLQFQKWELCPDGHYCWGRPRPQIVLWIYCWLLFLPGDVRVRIGAGLYHWRELPQVSFLSPQTRKPLSLHSVDPFRSCRCRTATTNQNRLQSSTTPPKRTLGPRADTDLVRAEIWPGWIILDAHRNSHISSSFSPFTEK